MEKWEENMNTEVELSQGVHKEALVEAINKLLQRANAREVSIILQFSKGAIE